MAKGSTFRYRAVPKDASSEYWFACDGRLFFSVLIYQFQRVKITVNHLVYVYKLISFRYLFGNAYFSKQFTFVCRNYQICS